MAPVKYTSLNCDIEFECNGVYTSEHFIQPFGRVKMLNDKEKLHLEIFHVPEKICAHLKTFRGDVANSPNTDLCVCVSCALSLHLLIHLFILIGIDRILIERCRFYFRKQATLIDSFEMTPTRH